MMTDHDHLVTRAANVALLQQLVDEAKVLLDYRMRLLRQETMLWELARKDEETKQRRIRNLGSDSGNTSFDNETSN